MKVVVLGGGPAGLYAAIQLRKSGHEVVVLERNAPDATFGWGVVFSEETLGSLRDADPPTYVRIRDSFARWAEVDIRFRGRTIRSRGHVFSAIARKRLLAILQERARELGASLRFETEVDGPAGVEADLVVAADGANSRSRAQLDFGARTRPQGGKYVWFGTDLVLDAFTFAFRETEHGLFQAHAYPFDGHTSTWIVECAEDVWRAAGLDHLDEAGNIAFCQELFRAELAGHRVLSNRSLWLDFPLVQCDRWHRDNVVLLGDAAHTAHFSIGSGTKLAIEDAIELATALEGAGELDVALTEYESARRPMVERFQQAAADSAGYFLRTARYQRFEPVQFAFNLLTRSGRITHANLTQRDPHLVRALDAFCRLGEPAPPGAVAAPPMFSPLTVGGLRLANRIVVETPDEAGAPEKAATGAGLVLAGPVAIDRAARVSPETPVLSEVDWTVVAAKVREAGARLGVRLTHAGARGATQASSEGVDLPLPPSQSWPLVAASPIPYTPFAPVPSQLNEAELDQVRTAFADAATKTALSEVDLLELDMADGRLLAGFLSPLTNRRTDRWGQDRWAYPLSVLDAVRAAWPAGRPLSVRLTVADRFPGGLTEDEGIRLARAVREHGADLVHVRAGHSVADSRADYRSGHLTALSDRVRTEAGVPTLVSGYLTTPDEVNTAVGAGRADLCVLAPVTLEPVMPG
ncbi:FAD-dependent monooxygenase [Amycolatopsis pithecellobii]|uniref:NAD(P)-binding protein n=1 Tax=Amycolatopsis pithecellobii TaxID=664692 RepID=A0A6N7YSN9_9PSEU|nr:FAD-dependent monooxygenase [Amycolatopsis pithecellobii]MTD56045.1 NAD(P)-binding protein [Amycolatopsis pithecellobii]